MKAHVSAVHRKIRGFQCQFCKYASSNESDLKKHVLKVHESKELHESNEKISLVRKWMCDFQACYLFCTLSLKLMILWIGKKW